ncbi:MAG: T9SS type A sorting domain-containing protein [Saprospiraceae bacterium]
MKFFLTGVICLLITIHLPAQGCFKSLHVTSKNEQNAKLIQTSDGGFVVVGETYDYTLPLPHIDSIFLLKTNIDGEIQWKRILGDLRPGSNYGQFEPEIAKFPDGSLLLAANILSIDCISNVMLWKMDSLGNVLDTLTILSACMNDLITTIEGGFAMAANFYGQFPNCSNFKYGILVLDSTLNILGKSYAQWQPLQSSESHSICQLPDGQFVARSVNYFFQGNDWRSDHYLDIYQATGEIIRSVFIDHTVSGNIERDGIANSNYPYVIFTFKDHDHYEVRKADGYFGGIVWSRDLNTPGYTNKPVITGTSDDGSVTAIAVGDSIQLFKLDLNGQIKWFRNIPVFIPNYPPLNTTYHVRELGKIEETADHGFIITGNHEPDPGEDVVSFLLKVDSIGRYVPEQTKYDTIDIGVCFGEIYHTHLISSDTIVFDTTYLPLYIEVTQMNIKVLSPASAKIQASFCEGSQYIFGQEIIMNPGIYERIEVAQNGCDSVITLTLEQLPSDFTALHHDLCRGEIDSLTGILYDTEGEFNFLEVLVNQSGCDSVVDLSVTVHPEELVVSTYFVNPGEMYHGIVITQDTQFLSFDTTAFGCPLIYEEQVFVLMTGLNQPQSRDKLLVTPNPFSDQIRIELNVTETSETSAYLLNAMGQKEIECWTNKTFPPGVNVVNISTKEINPGIYFLYLDTNSGRDIIKLVK